MGRVSDHVIQLVKHQVDEHGLVVWFDPERAYGSLFARLSLPETALEAYDGSFYGLRRRIEPLLDSPNRPRLVVYVPLGEEQTEQALAELTTLGTVLKPGQHPWQRNTRLSVIARFALRAVLPETRLAEIERDVQSGRLSLEELDRIGEEPAGGVPDVLRAIFETEDPEELVLAFLNDPKYDSALLAREAIPRLLELLQGSFGLPAATELDPGACRTALARHLLCTEFLLRLGTNCPRELASVPVARTPEAQQACVRLVETWRLRRDMAASYMLYAEQVERQLDLRSLQLNREQLETSDTFAILEEKLQDSLERALAEGPSHALLQVVQHRRQGFWASQRPEIRARWLVIEAAGEFLTETDRVKKELTSQPRQPGEIASEYVGGECPWCLMDTAHRHMERLYRELAYDSGADREGLEILVQRARRQYSDVAGLLAEGFVRALSKSGFDFPDLPAQSDVWPVLVKPAVQRGKTALLLIDALRFEMARELQTSLAKDFDVTLRPVVGIPPTVTDVGMAALLPGADEGLGLLYERGDRLAVRVGGTVLTGRKARIELMKARAPLAASGNQARVHALDLDALHPPSPSVRREVGQADLIVVTSQDLDELGESASVGLARGAMEETLKKLSRAAHTLAGLGCETVLIATDHGYLFLDEAGSEMKIDPPGGETALLRRRVWLGRGGEANPSVFRIPLRALGIQTDLEMATPWGLGVFRAGGSLAYYHGGLSPQELLLPVLEVRVATPRKTTVKQDIQWELVPGAKKIATGFFSVEVRGQAAALFGTGRIRVRAEIHLDSDSQEEGRVISRAVAATYGYDLVTGDVDLRWRPDTPTATIEPNTITLQLTQRVTKGRASIILFDATTNRELARLGNIEVAMTV